MLFNNKGFIIAETMIVASIVAITVITIYGQFSSVYTNYQERAKYENVDSLYKTNDVKEMIKEDSLNYFALSLDYNDKNSNMPYVDISSCTEFLNPDYCLKYKELVGIDRMLFTYYDVSKLLKFDTYSNNFSSLMLDYIEYLSGNIVPKEGYRIIVEFKDDTFASIKVG